MKFSRTLLLLLTAAATQAQPVIQSLSPASGPVGTTVTLNGSNFGTSPSANIVHFGPVRAAVTAASANSLTVTVPAGATSGLISVLNTTTQRTGFSQRPFQPTFTGSPTIAASQFRPSINFTSGAAFWNPQAVAVGDMDGDGKTDLLLLSESNPGSGTVSTLSVYRNLAAGAVLSTASFAQPVHFNVGSGVGANALAVGDLDNDGRLDIAIANLNASVVTVFRNTATAGIITAASLGAPINVSTGDGSRSVAIGDVDLDGRADLIASNSNAGDQNSVSVIRNVSAPGALSFETVQKYATGRGNVGVAVHDLDGDGKPEIATANYIDNNVSVLRNTASVGSLHAGSFAPAIHFSSGAYGPWSITIPDMDNDGWPDLVAGGVGVFRHQATGGSINGTSFGSPVSLGFSHTVLVPADVNGDAKPDVVVAADFSPFGVAQNNAGPGNLTAASFSPLVELNPGFSPKRAAVADLDGDGRPEIITTNAGFSGLNRSMGILQQQATGVTLPLRLLAFDAQKENSDVRLHWRIAAVENEDLIAVERSTDGRHYETIAIRKAEHNNNRWQFTDNNVPWQKAERMYYRLRLTGSHQPVLYSGVRMIGAGNRQPAAVYPNPASVQVTIALRGLTEVRFFDAAGRRVKAIRSGGSDVLTVDAGSLPKGLLLVQLCTVDGVAETRRLVVR